MRPPMEIIPLPDIGAELIYSFVIIVCSLMIYYGTRELYELSSYKGIKYFRQAFLFFAFAYFFRSFIKFILFYSNMNEILEFSPKLLFGTSTLFIFMYLSSMAVFYLLYSVMWKKFNGSKIIYLFHLLAFILAAISIASRSHIVLLGINVFLLFFVSSVVYISHKQSRNKKEDLFIIYILLLVFWAFNVIDILIPMFLQTYKLIIYLASSFIFLTILYRVLRKTGN